MPFRGERNPLPDATLLDLFRTAVLNRSNHTAIFDVKSNQRYTYDDISSKSDALARYVLHNLTKRSSNVDYNVEASSLLVAVCMEPSAHLIICLLALLKAEAAYLPIDVTTPVTRFKHILADAKPDAVIVNGDIANLIESNINNVPVFDLRTCWTTITQQHGNNIPLGESKVNPLLATLYTSGSTGVPKGVKLSKSAVFNRLVWQWEVFPYSEIEVCCFKTALTFVDSISEIYGPLLTGHQLIVMPRLQTVMVEGLVNALDHHKVGRISLVPTLLRSILFHCSRKGESLKHLRLWICSGEIFPSDLLEDFFRIFKDDEKEICNFYGSTEVLGDVTYASFERSIGAGNHPTNVAIGKPIFNSNVYVVNSEMAEVCEGEIGEILVSGLSVCEGYIGNANLGKFLTNIFSNEKGHKWLYRTGDFGRIANGLLYFEGRKDDQIKIRGHKIDINEVHSCVQSIKGVDRCSIMCYNPGKIDQMLLCFFTSIDATLDSGMVRREAECMLPAYMVPQVHHIKEIPLLISGKVDGGKLLHAYKQNGKNISNKMKIKLEDCPCELKETAEILLRSAIKSLGPAAPSSISLEDSYSKIGGNSLNILLLLSYLQDLGQFISIDDFLTARNFHGVLSMLTSSSGKTKSLFGKEILDEGKYAIRKINAEDFDVAIRLLAKSFWSKGQLERASGVTFEAMLDSLSSLSFDGTRSLLKLSFVIYEVQTGEISGVSMNFDSQDEDDLKLISEDVTENYLIQFFEYCETMASRKFLGHKYMHSFLMGTKTTLSSLESLTFIHAMEVYIMEIAKKFHYDSIITTNSSLVTQQMCQDLFGYTVLEIFTPNQWVAPDGTTPFKNTSDAIKLSVECLYL